MGTEEYKGPERRGFMRLSIDCAMDYVRLSKDLKASGNIIGSSYTEDLSASGINFLSAENITIGTFLELRIRIPPTNKAFTAIGKVVRCETAGKQKFKTAVSFVWISENDKKRIDEYVKDEKLKDLRSKIEE